MSGIPDYRDESGAWKRRRPMLIAEFLRSAASRRRYWSRSFVGWPLVSDAQPNLAHESLAKLEQCLEITSLVTQNVDGLHQRAGSQRVLDLHGRLDQVRCMACRQSLDRRAFQTQLADLNPQWIRADARFAPDGDADLEPTSTDDFVVPDCPACGGILKPAVVFFGEGVPRDRVEAAFEALEKSDAALIVGSSLVVWSGFRFARRAVEKKIPLLIINRGKTRADSHATVKVSGECGAALRQVLDRVCL